MNLNNPLLLMKSNLTAMEQDVLILLIYKIDSIPEKTVYEFKITEFKRLTGKNEKSIYADVRKAVHSIWKKGAITIGEEGLDVQLISSVQKIKNKGIIEIEVSRKLKPYLLEIKNKYYSSEEDLKKMFKIKGLHSKKIYEMCMSEYLSSWKEKLTLSIPELRTALGIKDGSYPSFKDFEKRILKEAISDINEVKSIENTSRVLITYEKDNDGIKGKPVNEISFYIDVYLPEKDLSAEDNETLKNLEDALNWGFLSFTNKEKLFIFKSVSEKLKNQHDLLAIIVYINKAVKHFNRFKLSVPVNAFVDYINKILKMEDLNE